MVQLLKEPEEICAKEKREEAAWYLIEKRKSLAALERGLIIDGTKGLERFANLYRTQGNLQKAEEMYQRVLNRYENTLGPNHTSTLYTVNNLGLIYADQGKLTEAEEMYRRALEGYALGSHHKSTLAIINNLGLLYRKQGKLKEAEEMHRHALQGYEEALGPDHMLTLCTVHNLGILYADQGKPEEAEEMYYRALNGYEKSLGPHHISIFNTVLNLDILYADQARLKEAKEMYQQALIGFQSLKPNHQKCEFISQALHSLHQCQEKVDRTSNILVHKDSIKRTLKDRFSSRLRKFFRGAQSKAYTTFHLMVREL